MPAMIYRGAILHAIDRDTIAFFPDGGLLVERGRIVACQQFEQLHEQCPRVAVADWRGSLIIPGLVDAHVHLPQTEAIGAERDNLLTWLEEVIFPTERKFRDSSYAELIAHAFFQQALAAGVTAMVVFAPPYEEATEVCFHAAYERGIRVTMGMTLMDTNVPEDLCGTPDELIAASERLAARWHNKGRLRYCITPRFAGSCSLELLKRCGETAQAMGLPIQTHLAESPSELQLIKCLFPLHRDYTSVYEDTGILSERTLLAHCIYLTSDELEKIEQSRAAIVHCPSSNVYLQSGIMPLAEYLDSYNIPIGIGSDIGAGYNWSMLREARAARECSKIRHIQGHSRRIISLEEAFYLATLGGAHAIGLAHEVGNFAVGKAADFVRVSVPSYRSLTTARQALEYLLYAGTEAILSTTIEGECVWQRP
ncbi:MAG: guanine deaminase [Bacteroidota bacterium]|nr:guanine deaminase [Candidatus Kapabacteria bacterium]MCS7302286.1 guanine deaminase [Candidatus Kapabacteria bacterium]MCX7936295.1 guanine deaminase [Chlorobiota bacterium]MDW8074423.1 guanine deaminase [Bacteroidota bacterium]MDW8271101.1 guanine deaminase [Bacteroidota bacterium]